MHKQQEDELARKLMRSLPLESPSKEFSANILKQLSAEPEAKLSYTPLISTPVLVTGVGSILLTVVVLYFNLDLSGGWFDKIHINNVDISNSLNFNKQNRNAVHLYLLTHKFVQQIFINELHTKHSEMLEML